ncbi:MAG: ABC transporter permease subunit [Chitinispirillia bacterium]|nr:ABC transporter permease subunit [Chitinispirillia bacterium]MCL2242486.1 ABC transporter permease subunit [Chitinispirillia bacterium]
MNTVMAIFKKEFTSYFISPIAYVFIIVFLIGTNFMYFQPFFLINQADMRNYFGLLPWVFLFFVPAITMRSWAEEKKSKTIELLLTWPLSDAQVVLGKFFATLAFLASAVALSVTIPVTLFIIGNPDPGPIIGGYVGALLMGAAYLAIGLWISSHTENQIVAFILAWVVIFVMMIIGHPMVTMKIPALFVPLFSYLGLFTHFESIERGVIDSRDVIYYLSMTGVFLYLNAQSLGSRKSE